MTATALCAAMPIGDDGVPDWLHLLPAGQARTHNGRGPYRVTDPRMLIAVSMASGKLALDENHATDLAAPKGLPAPARGWIVELQNRSDGIWARVDWTSEGRSLSRAYRGVSPVITHDVDGTVTAILRASLTNTPNLTGLTALHSKGNDMELRTTLIEALGISSAADDSEIAAAVREVVGRLKALQGGKNGNAPPAAQAALLSQQANAYRARLAAQGTIVDHGTAVRHISEGRAT